MTTNESETKAGITSKADGFDEPADEGTNYGGSRKLFRNSAHNFGVTLSQQEDYDWLAVMQTCMLVDHLADEEKTDISVAFDGIFSGEMHENLDYDAQVRAHNYMHRQSEAKQQRIIELIAIVQALIKNQRDTSSVEELIEIRLSEATVLTELLSLNVSDSDDAEARANFNSWLSSWAAVGYLLDSLIDMKADYDNGESSVLPTKNSRLRLLKPLARESMKAIPATPVKVLGECALNGFNYVVRNNRADLTT